MSSDDRWGWVTTSDRTDDTAATDNAPQKQHFTTATPGAGTAALDLWAPTDTPTPTDPDVTTGDPVASQTPDSAAEVAIPGDSDLAYSALDDDADGDLPETAAGDVTGVTHTGDVVIGGHGPGDDAPTATFPIVDAPPPQLGAAWTDAWTPAPEADSAAGDGLDGLVRDGRARVARTRSMRRAAIVAGFATVLAVVIGVGVYAIVPGDDAGPPQPARAAGGAPEGWCATGTNGSMTTLSAGGDQTSATGAVAAFISGLVDARSAATAHAAMSSTATAPTVDQLTGWIAAIPASTNGWCAQITTTDSAARVLVELRLHTGAATAQVGGPMTFYVSASTPTAWAIDAVVSDEGSHP